ncbi:MAG TPA: hypothetical protein VF017_23440 [Thermoanaerobaculia bacterium]|nr:hypothetical protein [Thermoanaerobaculia bacterium]
MKRIDELGLEQLKLQKELTKLGKGKTPSKADRRAFLKAGAALAAGAAAGIFTPKAGAQDPGGDDVPRDGAELEYNLDNFGDLDTTDLPGIEPGQDIEITARDFTRGLSVAVGGLLNLEEDLKAKILGQVAQLDAAIVAQDAAQALAVTSELRFCLVNNADSIDAAAGKVAFAEVTSYSQLLIFLVESLYFLGVRIIGVIWVFPWGQIYKILEVFEVHVTCWTVIQIRILHIYIRFFLFVLAIRFDCFPGPRWTISVFIVLVSICLRITVIEVFRICVWWTRHYLLLIKC